MIGQLLASLGIDPGSVSDGFKILGDLDKRFSALETKVNQIHVFILGCQADLADRDNQMRVIGAEIIDIPLSDAQIGVK